MIKQLLALLLCSTWLLARAEPYLAVQMGMQCAACHVNPAGGGQRNTFGSHYGHAMLPAKASSTAAELVALTTGKLVSFGANARVGNELQDVADRDDASEFGVDSVKLFVTADVTPNVTLYIDQQVAPGGSLNRESWIKLGNAFWYLKTGRIFLPFGWRLEDDAAFIRQATGINFDNPDNGLEVGYTAAAFNLQASLSNGTAGAGEVDDGKQTSLRLEYLQPGWRLGASGNVNSTDLGKRTMLGVFAGLKTGPVSWLAEWDQVKDRDFAPLDETIKLLFFEANYQPRKGHNIKLTHESLDSGLPAAATRYRHSVVWEYIPFTASQLRAGFRQFDSDNNVPAENRDEGFIQLHVYL